MSDETLVGGLTGFVNGSVAASYWDTVTSGEAASAGGTGVTTSPTGAGGIYSTWSADGWHFGTAGQYPVLAVDLDGNGEATWQEFGYQLRDGPALTATAIGDNAVTLSWTAVDVSHWTPAPDVAYTLTRDDGTTFTVLGEALGALTRTDTGLTDGATYTYEVSAVVDGGEAARSARVTAAVPCTFTVTPLHRDVLRTAGTEQVAVTTAPGCAWTAASESAFLAVPAGTAGAGPGTVRYTVGVNTGGPRRGALAVAGQRATVYQASPTAFTDHPVERGVTPVKAIHFLELRARIDALRTGAGRPAFGWTDPVLTPGATPIRRVHLTELRAALSEAYAAAGRAAPAYTDPEVTAGATVIRAAHLMELRAAVAALE